MSQPTPYTPATDFSQQESNNASGRSTVNTAALDAEFANVETTLGQVIENINVIQRDDGKIRDLKVELHTLSPEVLNLIGGFSIPGDGVWHPYTAYKVNDLASDSNSNWLCTVAHTSGATFSSSNWVRFGFTAGSDIAAYLASAQASATASENSRQASDTSAANAASSASSAASQASAAASSASSASSSASAAATSATQAANSAASLAIPSPTGSDGKALVASGSSYNWASTVNIGTTVNTTSGTSFDFSGIPSWVNEVTVMLKGVSTNGSSLIQIQAGSGSVDTTGYACAAAFITNSGAAGTEASIRTTGVPVMSSLAASETWTAIVTFRHMGGNIWSISGGTTRTSAPGVGICGGDKSFSAALDRIRVTTVNGTDVFDAGKINIGWR